MTTDELQADPAFQALPRSTRRALLAKARAANLGPGPAQSAKGYVTEQDTASAITFAGRSQVGRGTRVRKR